MILTALKELAEKEGLMQDLDYQQAKVTRIIELGTDGELQGITDVRDSDAEGTPHAVWWSVPKFPVRTSGIRPQFLYDKSDYVLGAKLTKDGLGSSTDRHLDAAIELIESAYQETHEEGLKAVHAFLKDQKNKSDRADGMPDDLEPGDWFVFRLAGDNGLISDRPAVKKWWSEHRSESGKPSAQCLITGAACIPTDKHDLLKNVPGGSTSGVSLVSYNSSAFESYGFSSHFNAPVSRSAAESYTRALNRLLASEWPDPIRPGHMLGRRNVRLSPNTAVVFWAEKPDNEFPDIFQGAAEADPEKVKRLIEGPLRGAMPPWRESQRFYALTLSGAKGRATARDWFVTSVGEMADRLRHYFAELELAFPFDNPPRPSLTNLLRSMAVRGEDKNIPPNLATETLQAILRDRPFPQTLLSAAVRRFRAEGALSAGTGGARPDWRRSHTRMQLTKAILARLRRHYPDRYSRLPEVTPMLDETNTYPAYLLGRLFAVLENLQAQAIGQANATIADRFYGAASSTPAITFGRLLRLSHHHLSKLRREKRGAFIYFDNLMGRIFDGLPAEQFPSVFSLEDQALFATGYYHQHLDFFKKTPAEEKTAAEVED